VDVDVVKNNKKNMEQIINYTDRNFMIFNVSEINKINFDEVLETSSQWLRNSINNEKTFVKWDGNITPNCVQTLTTSEGPYTYDEMLTILSTPEWTDPINVP
jgi:superfamily I DNA and/or RNA helicase